MPGLGDSVDANVFPSHLTPKQRVTIAKLVGEKCSVICEMNGTETEVLWDTGAQVSIIPKRILQDKFPDLQVKDIHELLEVGSDLKLEAANGTQIPYSGWVGVSFKLLDNTATEITVPFLVTEEQLDCPIIGYNLIELFVKDNGPEQVLPAVTKSFNHNNTDARTLVNFINNNTTDSLCAVRTSKRKMVIPRGQSVTVPCRANTGPKQRTRPALFEPDEQATWPSGLTVHDYLTTMKRGKSRIIDIPVSNTTQHDIVLPGRVFLGHLQLVRSVTPMDVKLKDEEDGASMSTPETRTKSAGQPVEPTFMGGSDRHPEVDLSTLTSDQQQEAIKMLCQEAEAFAKDDEDIGCVEGLQMNIHVTDNQPIQRNYRSIPRPLYPEVKSNIEDLLNRHFIRK